MLRYFNFELERHCNALALNVTATKANHHSLADHARLRTKNLSNKFFKESRSGRGPER